MSLRMYLAAAGMFLTSWFMRGGRSRYHRTTALLILIAPAMLGFPGCTSVNVVMLSSEAYTAQSNHVEILERTPTRPYVQIAVLSVDSMWLSFDSKREKILEKAATLGADAVIFGDLRLPQSNQANDTAGQSNPPASLKPQEVEKHDDLHSSSWNDIVPGEAAVFLVRGGHGGGHGGGGHGHGGHWGGRSGFRHWGRFYTPYYGPRFWGYGPGWWGGSYWGGYPYYGYTPYSYGAYPGYGYGYMNTLMVGTAIHYTD